MDLASSTVITPSLNHGRFLGANLASVALQGVAPVEQLILDGGSTDETADVIARFPHAELVSLPESNQSEALNAGFARAKGKYICWLNTDDIVMPGAFEAALARLETGGERVYLTSHYLFVNATLELVRKNRLPLFSSFLYRNYAVYLPTSGSFVTNTVAKDGISLDASLDILMDRDYALQLHEAGYRFEHIDDYLSAFRLHEAQKSGVGSLSANQEDPRAQRRVAERNQISQKYGGVYWRQGRVLPAHPALSRVAWASLVGKLRLNRLRVWAEEALGRRDMAPTLARWVHQLETHLAAS